MSLIFFFFFWCERNILFQWFIWFTSKIIKLQSILIYLFERIFLHVQIWLFLLLHLALNKNSNLIPVLKSIYITHMSKISNLWLLKIVISTKIAPWIFIKLIFHFFFLIHTNTNKINKLQNIQIFQIQSFLKKWFSHSSAKIDIFFKFRREKNFLAIFRSSIIVRRFRFPNIFNVFMCCFF